MPKVVIFKGLFMVECRAVKQQFTDLDAGDMSFGECVEKPSFYKDPDYHGPVEGMWELEEEE
ncbi:MAG: hypothetical protein M1822_004564 [Bathelium mastoideum]|nr:MAG: hypothetical protein M1822_004564 [Bathelium mastoideum]